MKLNKSNKIGKDQKMSSQVTNMGITRQKKNSKCIVYLSWKKNNLFVNLTDIKGQTIIKFSSGLIQKNKSKKQLSSVLKWIFEKLSYFVKNNFYSVQLVIKAPTSRSFFYLREFKRKRLPIISFQNRVALAHNGCRPPKKRRL